MGSGIDQETFDAGDYDRFQQRLTQCLSTLGRLLERPGFGVGPVTLGAELELFLVDVAARPLPLNQAVRAAAGDPRVTVDIRIAGADPLELTSDDVALEGANTSFQVHLRVDPAAFARTYNAVQAATAPVLAAAGNSPTFLGHRLWEETRIALCKQSIDDRDGRGPRRRLARMAFGTGWLRDGPLELFTDSVHLHQPLLPVLGDRDPLAGGDRWHAPPLAELRLHQSTVWRWNRAIYDPASGGHLRIELRALPAGPTVTDMLANAAFLIGLSRWLAEQDQRWTYTMSFERAEHGFHRAAQHGLAAELTWPFGPGGRLRTLPAAELVPEVLPAARDGLLSAGVAAEEADHLLGVIAARVATGQTGAVWQRRMLATLEPRLGRERALAAMLNRYLECAATSQPVHTWTTNP
jgi:hypothetical protein